MFATGCMKITLRHARGIIGSQVDNPAYRYLLSRSAATVGSKIFAEKEDKSFIDLNAEKLCSHACIKYTIEGENPQLLPDSEYPPWLFKLRLNRPKRLEDMDPETDGWLYWRAYKNRLRQQCNRIERLKVRFLALQDSPTMRKSDWRANKVSLEP